MGGRNTTLIQNKSMACFSVIIISTLTSGQKMRESILRTAPVEKIRSVRQAFERGLEDNAGIQLTYERTAEYMEERGLAEAARSMRQLADARRGFDATLRRLAAERGQAAEMHAGRQTDLPEELVEAWEEAAVSSLATGYRFLALGVNDAMRGFVYFSHLAAHAEDGEAQDALELIARHLLALAQTLRALRRQAYHADARNRARPVPEVNSLAGFNAFLERRESEISARLAVVAQRLAEMGEHEILRRLAERGLTGADAVDGAPREELRASLGATGLLIRAQRPLERLVEDLGQMLPQAGEDWREQLEAALEGTAARLAFLSGLAGSRGKMPDPGAAG